MDGWNISKVKYSFLQCYRFPLWPLAYSMLDDRGVLQTFQSSWVVVVKTVVKHFWIHNTRAIITFDLLNVSRIISAGSQFWNPGLFEVSKANQAEEEESPSNCLNDSSLLEVKVGSDLEGVASVIVSICETGASQETVKGKQIKTWFFILWCFNLTLIFLIP